MSERRDVSDEDLAEIRSEYEGFTITCECGSSRVALWSNAGFSAQSGGWGGYGVECLDCGRWIYLWEM